jgi:anaerobic magnesium-protoporphyrin IX monomethyl ester cyclase
MNILLIQPYTEISQCNSPPLGLMYLASALRAKGKDDVRIIDLRLEKTHIPSKMEEVLAFKPDVIGVTAMSIESETMACTIEFLAKNLPYRPFFIVGGSHATIFPEETAKVPYVNYVVLGEGEETIVELIQALKHGKSLEMVKGIAFLKDGEVFRTPPRGFISEIDHLPFPAWDLIDVEKYFMSPNFHDSRGNRKRIAPIFSSRGCPFRCAFCLHMMGPAFRARSAKNVLDEIKYLYNAFRVEELHIEDDIFNFDRKRANQIMQALIDEGIDVKICFPSGLKGDLLHPEDLSLYKKAGVYQICFGIESACDRILSLIGKRQNLEKINKVVVNCAKEGIGTHGFFMIGFPTENEQEIRQTIEFARATRLTTANFSLVKLFPGTQLYERFDHPPVDPMDSSSFSYDLVGYNLSDVNKERLMQLRALAYRRFYTKLRRIWDVWRFTPNKIGLFRKNLFSVLKLVTRGTNVEKDVN